MAGRILLWIVFMFTLFPVLAQIKNGKDEYGLLTPTSPNNGNNKDSVLEFFKLADRYMDADRYDSAEFWLSKVGDRLGLKKPGIFNFYYHSRQAEVFYYNNLLQIGQQQSNRALQIALQLKDSFFIADSYNFLGLFSLNLEKYKEAETFLMTGLHYFPVQKKQTYHLPLSEVYHLHGNMGETYVNLGKYQQALLHFDSSIQEARLHHAPRAQALALISAGEVLVELKNYDSALACVSQGRQLALQNMDNDVALLGFSNMANLFAQKGNQEDAYKWADEGLAFQRNQQGLNPYYNLLFMRKLAGVFSLYRDYKNVSAIQQAIITTEAEVRKRNNLQLESVLGTGLQNENKLLQLEVEEARQKQSRNNLRIGILLVIIALLIVVSLYYRNTLKQKLLLANMREKISRNLHDDIGASISSLHIFSTIAHTTLSNNPTRTEELLQKISDQSRQLMEDMNDMVWSMKGSEADGMTLATRLKNYGAELLTVKNIHCRYSIDEEGFRTLKNFDSRKNILLIIKEAMNNLAKYSEATQASLEIRHVKNSLEIEIRDNGRGFSLSEKPSGNGIKNMAARTREMNGQFDIKSQPGQGTIVSVYIPVP